VPQLLELLRDASVATRVIVLVALGKMGPDALPAVLPGLSDPSAQVRRHVASLAGKSRGEADVLVPLLREAAADADASVRDAALEALGRLAERVADRAPVARPPVAPSLLPVD
jgi:HEAT repeat protein